MAGLWMLLGLAWAAALLLAAATVASGDGISFVALLPAVLLGPIVFGAAAWVELRRRPVRPGARVELVAPGPGRGGIVVHVRRRRRAQMAVRVALVARLASGDLRHVEWQRLPGVQREAALRFWAPGDLALAEGDRWQVMVIEDEPWGSRHRALDLGPPAIEPVAPVGGLTER